VIGDDGRSAVPPQFFGDVLIGVGLILLALGVSAIIALVGGGSGPFCWAVPSAPTQWPEYFRTPERAHFPTLIHGPRLSPYFVQTGLEGLTSLSGIVAALITVGAMALFYARIRLPFFARAHRRLAHHLYSRFLGQNRARTCCVTRIGVRV